MAEALTTKLTCILPSPSSVYDIEIGSDQMDQQGGYLASLAAKFAIITHDAVAELYGYRLWNSLSSAGLTCHLFAFPDGEQHKNRAVKAELEDRLLEQGYGRDACIIGLGGGVVTDMAGFIAATYCRGIPFVSIPTTLLGMVDASIGGKTGVNTPHGKNMIGCIYQPKKVVIDTTTLKTLPQKEIVNGIVEIIKHSLIADADLFDYLQQHVEKILALDPLHVHHIINESCRIKIEIVQSDEKEQGMRRLLNAGHTIGHALERLTNYTLPHGECVAIGLMVECYMAKELGYSSEKCLKKLHNLLIAYGVPLTLPCRFSVESLLHAMSFDKKAAQKKLRFVFINNIGSAMSFDGNYCVEVDEAVLKKSLAWMYNALCCD